ncbi:MAG: YggW family oxidoreductase [Gammaproteobacteria bacterium RIFOXYA12_FULL_61_12]|nr:MAG: YggW family oxidoreductase [Gammaproteobacteria bacterium RIFOXYA12_FULL_61_12]OGT91957.1 MAG: YggW family oxidoreductase [Gammaproteobacteria bacterium RIFOXYD12_FULL_61_37]
MPLPPLALYIHFPWCLRKCPYCDFNSHELPRDLDVSAYVDALIADFSRQYPSAGDRPIASIFIGGGTPSLLPGDAVARLLAAIGELAPLVEGAEITLEANPGAADAGHFSAYRDSGVNRLSIGVQSFDEGSLKALGRIHGRADAVAAFQTARQAGFGNINLDLMFGLPHQTQEAAMADLRMAMGLGPEHLSWYQLTLEPNTPFSQAPPSLPDEDSLYDIQETGLEFLASSGMERYEVSAFSRPGRECRHNLNYWEFGDYLGIGAGAHGKLTLGGGQVRRNWKERHPRRYLTAPQAEAGRRGLGTEDLILEFMMNALRLRRGFALPLFEARTGLPLSRIEVSLRKAMDKGLLESLPGFVLPTELGFRFLNDLIGFFEAPA